MLSRGLKETEVVPHERTCLINTCVGRPLLLYVSITETALGAVLAQHDDKKSTYNHMKASYKGKGRTINTIRNSGVLGYQSYIVKVVRMFYKVDDSGKVQKLRKECPNQECGAGTFMANHFDRHYCGKCGLTYVYQKAGGD
ncbi:hypothetical protein IFM89_031213 [Coptis chinensis]|uniref:Small ribosomal subunit protein eS31 domain-containing protein n=1 Tax=Coptis chinensis TaxID=261450 RepID=A0A835IR90_9MAGN|nr:hypothetical protein IFM89_031213 [Coptis chinensis]